MTLLPSTTELNPHYYHHCLTRHPQLPLRIRAGGQDGAVRGNEQQVAVARCQGGDWHVPCVVCEWT